MKMLLHATMPHEPFNAAVRNGTAGEKLNRILDSTKPEAVYFTESDGRRSVLMLVDLKDPSQIPALVEPWFLTFSADVRFNVVMGPDELKRAGLEELGRKWA